MTWNIRKMHVTDIDDVYAIEIDVHVAPWSRGILKDCVLAGYDCLVLETQVADNWLTGGYMICRHSNNNCHILNFCIAKSLQSQGYGRKFLQHVLNTLVQMHDLDYVMLEVRPSNRIALHLYESLGFERSEIKKGYYKENEHSEDAILLKRMLHV